MLKLVCKPKQVGAGSTRPFVSGEVLGVNTGLSGWLSSRAFPRLLGRQGSNFIKPDCRKPHPHVYITLAFFGGTEVPFVANKVFYLLYCLESKAGSLAGETRPHPGMLCPGAEGFLQGSSGCGLKKLQGCLEAR